MSRLVHQRQGQKGVCSSIIGNMGAHPNIDLSIHLYREQSLPGYALEIVLHQKTRGREVRVAVSSSYAEPTRSC